MMKNVDDQKRVGDDDECDEMISLLFYAASVEWKRVTKEWDHVLK